MYTYVLIYMRSNICRYLNSSVQNYCLSLLDINFKVKRFAIRCREYTVPFIRRECFGHNFLDSISCGNGRLKCSRYTLIQGYIRIESARSILAFNNSSVWAEPKNNCLATMRLTAIRSVT